MGRRIAIVLTILVLVFILTPFGGFVAIQFVSSVLFGWYRYLGTTLPKIQPDPVGLFTFVLCFALVGVFGHAFCRWLWRSGGRIEPWKPQWTAAGLSAVVLLFASGMAFTGVAHQVGWLARHPMTSSSGRGYPWNAPSSLKTIATAQADFRANDRDGDREMNFWRADVAGLYFLKPAESTDPIKLIDISMAFADAAPKTPMPADAVRSPKAGYLYKALGFRGEKTPDPNRFAACAYAATLSAGNDMFIISQDNVIFRKRIEGEIIPPEFYPDDPLKEGWEKLD